MYIWPLPGHEEIDLAECMGTGVILTYNLSHFSPVAM